MKSAREILMAKAKSYRESRDKSDHALLTEALENCRDVLEHYDNDAMVRDVLAEVERTLRRTRDPNLEQGGAR